MNELDDILGEMDSLSNYGSVSAAPVAAAETTKPSLVDARKIKHKVPKPVFEDDHCLWYPSIDPPPLPESVTSLIRGINSTTMSSSCTPAHELRRVKAVSSLWTWLKTETTKRGYDVHTPTFERWLLTTRHLQYQRERKLNGGSVLLSDPVLPSAPKSSESVLLGQG
jgi:hypothetical protein